MSRRILRAAARGLLPIVMAWGCASAQPITTWYYSAWYPKDGAGSKEGFERARASCLGEEGISQAPESVAIGSAAESSFVMCMNAAGWCTNAYHCEKPGAS